MTGRLSPTYGTQKYMLLLGTVVVVVLTVLGVFFGLQLVKKNQDLRNQASVASGVVTITAGAVRVQESYPPKYIVELQIDTKGANIDAVQLVGKVTGFDKVENLTLVGALAEVKELKTVTSQTTGNSFSTAFTLTDPKTPFAATGARVFAQLSFTAATQLPQVPAEVVFDHTMSKATLYGTGKDALTPPKSIAFNVQSATPVPTSYSVAQNCNKNSDCPSGSICYSPPMPPCPEGMACAQVMPAPRCMPVGSPTPTIVPSPALSASPAPVGCHYVQPQCFTTPCDPILVCSVTPSPTPQVYKPTPQPAATPPVCQKSLNGQPICPADLMGICAPGSYMVQQGTVKDSCGCLPAPVCVKEPITQSKCSYQFSDWGACEGGVQKRNIIAEPQCSVYAYSSGPAPVLFKPCQTTQCSTDTDCGAKFACVDSGSGSKACELRSNAVDVNNDGKVNLLDISLLIGRLFKTDAAADLTGDGTVDILDYSLMIRTINQQTSASLL